MATFPEFRLTGPTIPLEEKPMEFKPLNLLPLIELLRESKQPIGKQASDKGKTPKDDKIEGRIGAVDQYESAIRKQMNIINKGFDLYGTSFSDMPEYKMAMTKYENLTSDDRKNVIARQTKDVDRYKEQTKGKGNYYHIGQWISSGMDKDALKRNSQWENILERGYTKELGNQIGEYDYIENFDFTPTLLDIEDSRQAADALYNPAVAGTQSIKSFTKSLRAGWEDNLYGSYERSIESEDTKNYGIRKNQVVGYDENGKAIIGDERVGLDSAHQQAVQRVFKQMFDPSDKLTAGYMQGFVQRHGFNIDDYYDKKGNFNIRKFGKEFGDYMEADLQEHYTKRKQNTTNYRDITEFKEGSPDAYKIAREQKEAELMNSAALQGEMSLADPYNFGINLDETSDRLSVDGFDIWRNYFNKDSKLGLSDAARDANDLMFLEFENSPFILNSIDGKRTINLNPKFSTLKFDKNDSNPMWKKALEYAKDMGTYNIPDPVKYANGIIDQALKKRADIKSQIDSGKGLIGNTRNTYTFTRIPTMGISQSWWDVTGNSNLKGQNAQDLASGMFGQLSGSYFNLENLGKNLIYDGTEGDIRFQPNRMPTNLYTILDVNGVPKAYNWNDSEWMALSDAEKDRLQKKALEDSKFNPIYGTGFRKGDLSYSNEVEFSSSREVRKMDNYTSEVMSKYVSNNKLTNNAVFASPGAAVQGMKFKAKDKQTIIKALENVYVDVEKPSNYGNDKQYKKIYDETFGFWAIESHGVADLRANLPNAYFSNPTYTKERVSNIFGIPEGQRDRFWEFWNKMPKNVTELEIKDLVVRSKTGGMANWNWNTTVPVLIKEPAAKNGTLNPYVQDEIIITETYSTDKSNYGASITIPGNVTPIIAKSNNGAAKEVLGKNLDKYSSKYVTPNIEKTKDNSLINLANPKK